MNLHREAMICAALCSVLAACGGVSAEATSTQPPPAITPSPTEAAALTPTLEPTADLTVHDPIAWLLEEEVSDNLPSYDLHLFDPSSLQITLIRDDDSGLMPLDLAWSPDGQMLAYVIASPGIGGNFFSGRVYTIDLSGAEREILYSENYPVGPPRWSPDGRQIAVAFYDPLTLAPVNVWLLDAAQELAPPRLLSSDGATYQLPAWSPVDANVLAVVSDRNGSLAIETVDLTGPEPAFTRLIDLTTPATNLLWSPDGTQLVFDQRESGTATTLMMLETSTGAASQLVPDFTGSARDLRWSPDGSRIAFVGSCGSDPEVQYVCVFALTDPTPSPLLSVFGWVWLDWSPDGQLLLVSGQIEDEANLAMSVAPDGNGQQGLYFDALSALFQPRP